MSLRPVRCVCDGEDTWSEYPCTDTEWLERLQASVSGIQHDYATMKRENAALKADNASLHRQVDDMRETLAKVRHDLKVERDNLVIIGKVESEAIVYSKEEIMAALASDD